MKDNPIKVITRKYILPINLKDKFKELDLVRWEFSLINKGRRITPTERHLKLQDKRQRLHDEIVDDIVEYFEVDKKEAERIFQVYSNYVI